MQKDAKTQSILLRQLLPALAFFGDIRIKRKYAVLFVFLLLCLLIFFAQIKAPVPTGDAEDYWEFACGVELDKFDGYFPYARKTGIFPDKDGWFFYYYQEHHGRHVFKVDKQSLLNQSDELFGLLNEYIVSTVQKNSRPDDLEKKNRRRLECLNLKEEFASNKKLFIDKVSRQSVNHENAEHEIASFERQWELGKLYWASIIFEAIFLPLWWLFSFHSGVFGKYNKKASVRLAFSPLLLFTPHYLGYAPYLFSFGPSGGILYPLFAMLTSIPFGWIPFNSMEIEILKLLPKPLFYISQIPFSPSAMSFSGSVSPTVLCAFACIVLILNKGLANYRARTKS